IKDAARRDLLLQDCSRDRMLLFHFSALDRGEKADRPDRMLVDSVVMIHVELHLRDDTSKVGNKAAEHPGLVHPSKLEVWMVNRGQHFHEQAVRPRISTNLPSDQREIAARRAHRCRMDFEILTSGERK